MLKIGDVVQLKSGGPKMTILIDPCGDYDNKKYTCLWFTDDGLLRVGEFKRRVFKTWSEKDKYDVISLKSGGPDMTISEINKKKPPQIFPQWGLNYPYTCQWFADGELKENKFMGFVLNKVPDED